MALRFDTPKRKANFSIVAARDFIKRELAAAGHADTTLTARDIAARKHEAAAGEMWIILKTELIGRKIDPETWCRKQVGVSARSMEHRAYLHRHWDTYLAARKADEGGQYGLVHAMELVRYELNKTRMKGKPFHSDAVSHRPSTETQADAKQNARSEPVRSALSGAVILWQADFREALLQVPADSVDVAIIDPPYFLRRSDGGITDYYLLKDGKKPRFNEAWDKFENVEEYASFTRDWITGVFQTLKDTGSMFISGGYHNIGIVNYLAQTMEVPIIGEIIWLKRVARPVLGGRRLRSTHETILWMAKSARYQFNYDDIRDADYANDPLKKAGTQMGSVWEVPTINQFRSEATGHPSQKPLALYRRILDMCGVEGGTVLDPMAGSGTSGVAAIRWGMKSILIEREAGYCDLIKKRIASESSGKTKAINDNIVARIDAAEWEDPKPPLDAAPSSHPALRLPTWLRQSR